MVPLSSDSRSFIVQSLEQWIKRHVAYPDAKLGKCHKVVVKHLSVDKKPQGDVTQISVKLEEGGEDEIAPLLNQIADAAQNDANDLNSGVQQYAICAYYTVDRNYVARKVFRVTSVDEESEKDISPSEPPTERGLTAQLMRHNEAMARQMTITTSMQLQTMEREISRLASMNEKFSSQQVDFIILVQDLLDNTTKRRLDEKREEANLVLKEEGLAKVASLLPFIINKLAGQPVLPTEDPSFMLMASFLENLTEAQQEQLLSSCSDSQKMVLASIVAEYEKKKSKLASGSAASKFTKTGAPPALPDLPGKPNAPRGELQKTVTPPNLLPVHERLTASTEASSDPRLRQIEESGMRLMARFRENHPSSPPKQGEPK